METDVARANRTALNQARMANSAVDRLAGTESRSESTQAPIAVLSAIVQEALGSSELKFCRYGLEVDAEAGTQTVTLSAFTNVQLFQGKALLDAIDEEGAAESEARPGSASVHALRWRDVRSWEITGATGIATWTIGENPGEPIGAQLELRFDGERAVRFSTKKRQAEARYTWPEILNVLALVNGPPE
jgi:hypothetical protein